MKMTPKGKLSRARLRTTGKEGYLPHKRNEKNGKAAVDEEVWLLDGSHKFETSKEKEYACLGAHVWVFVLCVCLCI
jgi:hypothetical protein